MKQQFVAFDKTLSSPMFALRTWLMRMEPYSSQLWLARVDIPVLTATNGHQRPPMPKSSKDMTVVGMVTNPSAGYLSSRGV